MDHHRGAAEGGRYRRVPASLSLAVIGLACVLAGSLLFGCSGMDRRARESADRAGYGIIAEKQRAVFGQADEFSIEDATSPTTRRVLDEAPRLSWDAEDYTRPACLIPLSDALAVAVANNRDYRSQKEALFSQALGLSEVRRDFGVVYTAGAGANISRVDADGVETFGGYDAGFGLSRILATGARVSLDLSHSLFRMFSGGDSSSSNGIGFAVTQPLLRTVGPLVTKEPLRQSERSLVYSVRSFRRYQQAFIIQVISEYYGLLQSEDAYRNAEENLRQAEFDSKKIQRLAEGGRQSDMEVDQVRQRVLSAEVQLSTAKTSYERQLDRFKVFLGLPLDLDLGPDPAELERLAERGLVRPDMQLGQAIEIALAERLDYRNQIDRLEDATRALAITTMSSFQPSLDLSYGLSASESADGDRLKFGLHDNTQNWSLSLGNFLDWTPRRNAFRLALIRLEQSRRGLDLFHDDLILEVRDAWRSLEQQRAVYEIQVEGVDLAERRVRHVSMLLERGRATTRDLLEAQDALLSSRNAATAALVSHTVQRLNFWNTIGRLEIDPKGMWYE